MMPRQTEANTGLPSSAELPELISVREAAGLLRMHTDSVLRAIASGRIRSIRLSKHGRHRIPKADVLALLERGGGEVSSA